ncbi:uncharacterized protein F5147DRAFT_656634 [Suillus discolor]|uniref:Uncharacterized protein n=1 Tax=Suillus discolor TaxID=1912936 RepID=A0A9P7JPY4_9AGAM|nr:uncharacterized protein F5147DRAFT_656634 [Suillus discolor]KAG2096320.1 hypothetical protein F5147DRAFT_656634 [Suillus discolor]
MTESGNSSGSPRAQESSLCIPTSPHARAKRRIAVLEEEVEILKQDKVTKQRKTTYYISQGRAIRCMVALYTPIEDLIAENDWHCEDGDSDTTIEQDRHQCGYIELSKTLPWIHQKLMSLNHEESEDMLRKGGPQHLYYIPCADSARGDNMGTLKELVASTDDKHHRGFVNDACGRMLCPAEWRWDDPVVRAGIRDRTTAYIVSENSWPLFMYEGYEASVKNLERGLMKSKLLVMGFKAIFTSPSSANEADGDSDGADILENNRRAKRRSDQARVKTCVASIIGMRKVTPRAIAYTACQVQFALSNITSWRTVDADFDYQLFWNNIVDFFEDAPGRAARARVHALLEWKVFGRNHRQDLTLDVISQMSVSALAAQRLEMEAAAFDSD